MKCVEFYNQDRSPTRSFLIQLSREKDLEALKKKMSKATFYRNLKSCEEKGYIINGKLTRKIKV